MYKIIPISNSFIESFKIEDVLIDTVGTVITRLVKKGFESFNFANFIDNLLIFTDNRVRSLPDHMAVYTDFVKNSEAYVFRNKSISQLLLLRFFLDLHYFKLCNTPRNIGTIDCRSLSISRELRNLCSFYGMLSFQDFTNNRLMTLLYKLQTQGVFKSKFSLFRIQDFTARALNDKLRALDSCYFFYPNRLSSNPNINFVDDASSKPANDVSANRSRLFCFPCFSTPITMN